MLLDTVVDRAAARNRAILWLLSDTGIRLSELCGLRACDFDRKKGQIIVMGKVSKEHKIALGQNCQRHLWLYLFLEEVNGNMSTSWLTTIKSTFQTEWLAFPL